MNRQLGMDLLVVLALATAVIIMVPNEALAGGLAGGVGGAGALIIILPNEAVADGLAGGVGVGGFVRKR